MASEISDEMVEAAKDAYLAVGANNFSKAIRDALTTALAVQARTLRKEVRLSCPNRMLHPDCVPMLTAATEDKP